ncbi:hypothetical protein Barb6_00113 [Bacteroidales bacterium Barb6]|nr:hypothetical protein Barb6_00113 [Bacteroidales bacterium Barb6]
MYWWEMLFWRMGMGRMSQFDGRRQGNSDYLSNEKGERVCFVLRIINGKQSCFYVN